MISRKTDRSDAPFRKSPARLKMGNTGVSSCEIISGKLGGTISNKRNQNCMFVGGCYESNQDYCWYVKSNCKLGIDQLETENSFMINQLKNPRILIVNPFERPFDSSLRGSLLKNIYLLTTNAPTTEFPSPTTAKPTNTAIIPKLPKTVKSKS